MIEFYFMILRTCPWAGPQYLLTSNEKRKKKKKPFLHSFTDKLPSIVLMLIHYGFIFFVTKCSGVLHSQPLIEAKGPVMASLNESRSERNGT